MAPGNDSEDSDRDSFFPKDKKSTYIKDNS